MKIKEKIGNVVSETRDGVSEALSNNRRNLIFVIVGAVLIFGLLSYHALSGEDEAVVEEDVEVEEIEDEGEFAADTSVDEEESDYEILCKSAWVCDKGERKIYMVFEPAEYDMGKQSVHIYAEFPDKPMKNGRYGDDGFYDITLENGIMSGTSYDYGDIYKEYSLEDGKLIVDGDEYKPYDTDKLIHYSFDYGTGEDQVINEGGGGVPYTGEEEE